MRVLVARLDGMPLAIELAAARVDALGVAQLLDRLDDRFGLLADGDRFGLLADGDRLAEGRHRSLAAAVQWSYQLLDDCERRVFRAVSVFPGPFTLEGAEAVAGSGAGQAVLRLVDCSLLAPPRYDPDGRSRYLMLETLRAYGAGLLAEASEDGAASAALADYALAVAEASGYQGLEAVALASLSIAAWYSGDRDGALQLARRAQRIPEEFAGSLQRGLGQIVTMVLTETGDLAAADEVCTAALASCRKVGDLTNLSGQLWHKTILDLRANRIDDATAHLREQLQIAMHTGQRSAGLDCCGRLCAATRRPAEAVTMWAARAALAGPAPLVHGSIDPALRAELRHQAEQLLGAARAHAAQERGAAMSLAAAAEYALMLAAAQPPSAENGFGASRPAADPAIDRAADGAAVNGAGTGTGTGTGLDKLSPRERELVTLVAQGRTDAQIAAQLYISVRTVSSHLDRIRDKTGCRRRADLTRLALSAGLV